MIGTLVSFLGGSAFRMVWGEVSAWMNAKQEHAQEMERMTFQEHADAQRHARNLAAIRLQAELGVKTVHVQAEADVARSDVAAFGTGVELTGRRTGSRWIDAWNGMIRPLLASVSIGLVVASEFAAITMSENGWALAGAALGIYVADRTLFKRGK